MMQSNEHAPSYYRASANAMVQRPALEADLSADVCVIGGGFTGVNTAIELAQRGLSVILLEARRIGWGASGRNGGQLIRGIGHDVSGFAKYVGEEGVRYMERAGIDSVALVGQRIAEHGIDCDLRWGFCELANTPAQFAAFKGEQAHLRPWGMPMKRGWSAHKTWHRWWALRCMPAAWSTWVPGICTRLT